MLKAISGHTSTRGIRRYLTKEGRALAEDYINLEPSVPGRPFDWAEAMDRTRRLYGNNSAWRGRRARTYKHYVVSPDPKDRVSLDGLRALATGWARECFPDHEVSIVYHDDNAGGIPHAHVVVNNTNLETGRRLQDPDPKALARSLQGAAESLGMSPLEAVPRSGGAPASEACRQNAPRRICRTRRKGALRPRGVLVGCRHTGQGEGGALGGEERDAVQEPPRIIGRHGVGELPPCAEAGCTRSPTGRHAGWAESGWGCPTAGRGWSPFFEREESAG